MSGNIECFNKTGSGRFFDKDFIESFKVKHQNRLSISRQLKKLSNQLSAIRKNQLSQSDRGVLESLKFYLPQIGDMAKQMKKVEDFIDVQKRSNSGKKYTIRKILESMIKKANNQKAESVRKRNCILKLLRQVKVSIDAEYEKFYSPHVIQKIVENTLNKDSIQADTKRKHLRYVRDLIKHAHILEPDLYKENLINLLPVIAKTPKSQQKPHLPYSDAQLLQIFDPKFSYFERHPDEFWTTLIALFTGARLNAATTLQYGDITRVDGIDCIQFVRNHNVKHLKTAASERIVPIPSQLLQLGFVDYIKRKQQKMSASDSDFIFPRCRTISGEFNNKYAVRGILLFFRKIGVKTKSGDMHDFHSFRKNASLRLQEVGVLSAYINDIIGWEGKNTMEQSYSNHTLAQIKTQVDKLRYDFLQPHFDKWKGVMSQLY